MSKLFEHKEGNVFKLSEWDDEEIYDPAFDESGYYPKENKSKRITKFEEQEGLNFIIRYLVPMAVNNWNSSQKKRRWERFANVTPKDVIRNLKKMQVYRAPEWHPGMRYTDVIYFKSKMTWFNPPPTVNNEPCSFVFTLFKNPDLNFKFMARWSSDFFRSVDYPVGVDTYPKPPPDDDDVVDAEELNETEEDVSLKISKQEEEIAFQFIKRVVVPLDVRNNNKEIDQINLKQGKNYQFSHVKVEDVLRTLKKTEDYHSRQHGQQIIKYETTVPDPHPKIGNRRINRFWYTIFKSVWDKKLMVTVGQYTNLEVGKPIPGDKIQFI